MMVVLNYEMVIAALSSVFAFYKAVCWVMDRYDIGAKRREAKLMRQATMFLMCEIIRSAHQDCTLEGYVDEDNLQHIEKTYEVYKALGGNGTAERWMHELRALPKKVG